MTDSATPPMVADRVTIDVRATQQPAHAALAGIRAGLLREPPEIAPKYFYDDAGSRLFDAICATPEYYQTRTECALLARVADEIVSLADADELVELGSGAITKARILLDAMGRAGASRRYVPFDVNESVVRRGARELIARYPEIRVHGVIGEFARHLEHLPDGGRRLVSFLGGTIGNFQPAAAAAFMQEVAAAMAPGDFLLLGTDLIKDRRRLEAAYNDAAGLTARFNLNILEVINRLAGADFEPPAFEHRAIYNETEHRIEMWLRASRAQVVRLEALRLRLAFPAGRRILTEISVKFDRQRVAALLAPCGFSLRRWFTDHERLFALTLAERV